MRNGAWNFKLLSMYAKMIDTCVYQGKRYALYYMNILILVSITDMWYIYVNEYMRLKHKVIIDDLLYKLGDD